MLQIDQTEETKTLISVLDEEGKVHGLIDQERAKALELKSGDKGLWTKIRIDIPEIQEMIEKGTLNSFSWQGRVELSEVWSTEHERMVTSCDSVDLLEISVVTVPANEKSYFNIAKSFIGKLAKQEPIKKEENLNENEFLVTTELEKDGHYHLLKLELIDGVFVGRSTKTIDGEEHTHAVNSLSDMTVTNKSNVG